VTVTEAPVVDWPKASVATLWTVVGAVGPVGGVPGADVAVVGGARTADHQVVQPVGAHLEDDPSDADAGWAPGGGVEPGAADDGGAV